MSVNVPQYLHKRNVVFRVPDICLGAIVESASPVWCECGRVFVTRLSVRITQAMRCLGKTYHHYETGTSVINALSPELNPICHLLALL